MLEISLLVAIFASMLGGAIFLGLSVFCKDTTFFFSPPLWLKMVVGVALVVLIMFAFLFFGFPTLLPEPNLLLSVILIVSFGVLCAATGILIGYILLGHILCYKVLNRNKK